MDRPLKYYENNTLSTVKFIEVCCKNNIKKFIFSSTCAVYGDPLRKKVSENDECFSKSHYAKSKLLSEILLQNYSKQYFGLIIFRYFNITGADNQLRTGCINNIGQLFKNLTENIPNKKYEINIYGKNYNTPDRTCIRDFIDVNDLVFYHLEAIKKIKENKILVLNCGYNKGYSIDQIVKLFEENINKKIIRKYLQRRKCDIEKIICDNSKIKKIFNLVKNTNIRDSIDYSVRWEKKLINLKK